MKIAGVRKGSQAAVAGLRTGDRLITVNRKPVRDIIDLMHYADGEKNRFTFHRGMNQFDVVLDGAEELGVEFEPLDVRRCTNNCIFCFINQNPDGLRSELYLHDEDFRLSFLHGSYVTLADLGRADLERIVAQHLSPLYVSVHAADPDIRLRLLGRTKDDHLMRNLDVLVKSGIEIHAQIVVCPGINDGSVLEETITALRRRHRGMRSVAVVPVGLTRYRKNLPEVRPVDRTAAVDTIRLVTALHDGYAAESGDGFVYCADEWYMTAGLDVPGAGYYDDFPQIENGVGMVRDFVDSMIAGEDRLKGGILRTGRFVLVTGMSMAPVIASFAESLSRHPGIDARVLPVVNRFYGETVTVSGLLTGGDITGALMDVGPEETVVLPPNCLNADGLFLDGMTPDEVSERTGAEVIQGSYDPYEIFC